MVECPCSLLNLVAVADIAAVVADVTSLLRVCQEQQVEARTANSK